MTGKHIQKAIAEMGGGWDKLEVGNSYVAHVVSVPREGELTPEGTPKLPICIVKDKDGHFIGRLIVTEVDRPIKVGQKLRVFLTVAQSKVLFRRR